MEEREWDGKYSADFRDLLEEEQEEQQKEEQQEQQQPQKNSTPRRKTGRDNIVRPVSLEGMARENEGDEEGEEGDDVYISLVDGKVHRKRGRMLDNDDDDEQLQQQLQQQQAEGKTGGTSTSTTLVSAMPDLTSMLPKDRHVLALQPAKDASDYMLRMREYKGLEQRCVQTMDDGEGWWKGWECCTDVLVMLFCSLFLSLDSLSFVCGYCGVVSIKKIGEGRARQSSGGNDWNRLGLPRGQSAQQWWWGWWQKRRWVK